MQRATEIDFKRVERQKVATYSTFSFCVSVSSLVIINPTKEGGMGNLVRGYARERITELTVCASDYNLFSLHLLWVK